MTSEFDTQQRERMVRELSEVHGLCSRPVLEALSEIPREVFLPAALADRAYVDEMIALDAEHCLPSPVLLARMLEALDPAKLDRVLVVGDGTGYASALLGRLCGRVTAVTRRPERAGALRAALARSGAEEAHVVVRDESGGFARHAPY